MNRILNRASTLLLLFLGVPPQIYLLAETLGCKVETSMFFWIIGLCVLVWIAACFHNGLLIGMPLSALALYAAYRSYDANPSVQLVDLFDRITGVYYDHFYAPGSNYVFNSTVGSHSLLLVFLAFLLASYLAASLTSRRGRIPLSLLGSLPVIFACLSVNGNPSSLILLPFVLFVVLLLVTGSRFVEENGNGITLFTALLPVTILLCILLLIYDPAHYEFDERDIRISQQVDRISAALSRWIGNSVGSAELYSGPQVLSNESEPNMEPFEPSSLNGWGALEGAMDLTQVFDFSVLDDPVMSVMADTDGTLYLRMVSYGDYSGTAWKLAEDPPVASSLPFTASAIENQSDVQHHTMSLSAKTSLPYSCVPYYCSLADTSDSFLHNEGQVRRTVSYMNYPGNPMQLTVSEEYESRESDYRPFAHQYYTRLPDSTASVMNQLCEEAGLNANDPDILQAVAVYVQNAGAYDLLTEPYPTDDYAVWFLTEAHRGYCIHFATAAAALYRSLGIPARVTAGYLLDAQKGIDVEVTAADAHAWVEVYWDGLGWLPVEVTGQNDARDSFSDASLEAPSEEVSAQEEIVSVASEKDDDMLPAEASGTGEVGLTDTESLPVGIVSGTAEHESTQDMERNASRIRRLYIVLLLILLPALLPLRRLATRILLDRAYHQDDRGKAAVAIYRSASYVKSLGAEIPSQIEICAEKARFSNHEITAEEINENLALLEDTIRNLYPQLKPVNRVRLKYWKGLL